MNLPFPRLRFQALALTLLLAACGGGGSKSTSAGDGGSSPPPPAPTAMRITGVAATGAPLAGARVTVVDAEGNRVGSTLTSPADGSYTLTTSTASAPLLLQAVGSDADGNPVVLHSALAATSPSAVVHLTPLTEAVVALALGSDPKPVFAAAQAQAAMLTRLAALKPASDFLKTLVKTPLADAKVGDVSKLDLVSDPSFAANKTGIDLVLEVLRVDYGTDSRGTTLLQLANKLAESAVEVQVDLEAARAELAKATPAPANAIVSTLKATTSPTAVLANLGLLDELTATLNKVIAEGGSDGAGVTGALSRSGLLGKYTQHDGSGPAALAARITQWAAKGMQLGRLQVTGCADETIAKTGCVRVAVAARVGDAAGTASDTFATAVVYDAKSTPKWMPAGNGHAADVAARSVAWLALAANGGKTQGVAATPIAGVQLLVGSTVAAASVQTPGGYVLPLVGCARNTLCIAPPPGAAAPAATATHGLLADNTVFRGLNNWLGSADLVQGARYRASLTRSDGAASMRSGLVRASFAAAPEASRFAVLDGVKPGTPLPASLLLAEGTVGWSAWAAANPGLRVAFVLVAYGDAGGTLKLVGTQPKSWSATEVKLAPAPEGFPVAGLTLWLAAVDSSGRWYYTSYTVY